MISTLDSAALLLAGAAAGLIGSAGGITSLVSYPALLAVGLPALSANGANDVALVGLLARLGAGFPTRTAWQRILAVDRPAANPRLPPPGR